MKTALHRLALLWAVALYTLPASAEHDVFGLGSGRDGVLDLQSERVINAYAQVTADVAAGTTLVPVSSSAGFVQGDLVMVLRTTGLEPVPASQDGSRPVDLRDSPVGQWELARLASVTGQELRLTGPLVRAYTGRVTQVIRVPEYTSVTLGPSGRLRAADWNPASATGGVLAFLATGAVTNNGVITASGAGFAGGTHAADTSGQTLCSGMDEPGPRGQRRGEGIASAGYGTTGWGSLANAGGGGVCLSSGGGGGGHGGPGGKGGRTWFGESAQRGRDVGGAGGASLGYTLFDRLTLGGGGGAGHCPSASGAAPDGGRGGGAIFIRALRLAGNGRIEANGATPPPVTECGAGGGGAGGGISLRLVETAVCGALQALGGSGGNVGVPAPAVEHSRGPGGGGGGGQVLLQASSATCALDARGGASGEVVHGATRVGSHDARTGDPGAPAQRSPGLRLPERPVLTEPASGATTNNPRPRLSGTASAGSQVFLLVGGTPLGSAVADASGRFSFTPAEDLPDGAYAVTPVAELDALHSPAGLPVSFTVDTLPPATTVSTPAEGEVMNTRTPAISGLAEPGSRVTVTLDGLTLGTAVAASGTWTFVPPSPLLDGVHTVQARAVDAAGNEGPAAASTFTVDTTPPGAPALVGPAQGALVASTRPEVYGTAEPGSTVTVVLDGWEAGTAQVSAQGAWTFVPTASLWNGAHRVSARVRDAAGNEGPASGTHEFTVDSMPPQAPVLLTPAPCASVSATFSTFTGTAEPGATVIVFLDRLEVGSARVDAQGRWSLHLTVAPLPGSHLVSVSARDAAGNVGPSEARSFTVDVEPPAAPRLTSPPPDAVLTTSTPVFSGTAEPGSTVTVLLGGEALGTASVDGSGAWSLRSPFRLADGWYQVRTQATDSVGLTGPASEAVPITLDTTAPDTFLSGGPEPLTEAREATFELAASEAGATFECSRDRAAWAPCTSPLVLTGLGEGTHTLAVRARDAARHVDATPATHTWTIRSSEVEGGGGCAAGGGSTLAPLAWLAWAAWLLARGRRGPAA